MRAPERRDISSLFSFFFFLFCLMECWFTGMEYEYRSHGLKLMVGIL